MISATIITLLIASVHAGPVHIGQGHADLNGITLPDTSIATQKRAGVPAVPAAPVGASAAPINPPAKLPGRRSYDAYPAPPYRIDNANEVYRGLDVEVDTNVLDARDGDDCDDGDMNDDGDNSNDGDDDSKPISLTSLVDIKAIKDPKTNVKGVVQDPKTNVKGVANDACAIRKRYVAEMGVNSNDKIKDLLDDIVIELQRREGPLDDCDMPDHFVHVAVKKPAPGNMNMNTVANANAGPMPKSLDDMTATMCLNMDMPTLALALKVNDNAVEARCHQLQQDPQAPVAPQIVTAGAPGPQTVRPQTVSTVPQQTCTCP